MSDFFSNLEEPEAILMGGSQWETVERRFDEQRINLMPIDE